MRKVILLILTLVSLAVPLSVLAIEKNLVKDDTNNTARSCRCDNHLMSHNKHNHHHNRNKMMLSHDAMMDLNKIYSDIKLTESQKQSMQEIMQQQKASIKKFHDLLKDNGYKSTLALYPFIATEHFNETALREKIEAENKLEIELRVELAKGANKIFNLLTPEQKNLVAQKHQALIEKM